MWFKEGVLLLGCFILVCLSTVDCSKIKKHGALTTKKAKHIKKKVSSSRVPNNGRKGPMSGGSWDTNFSIASLPMTIPIPKKKKNRKSKPQRKEADMNPKFKRSILELHDTEDDVVQRMRRDIDESLFTDEERRLRDEWFRLDDETENNIPSRETASFVPNDLKFIYDAGKTLADAYETLTQIKGERLHKRSLDDDVSEEEESALEQPDDEEQVVDKRDVTDYDVVADEDIMSENVARDMRVRDISPEEEDMSDDVTEIVSDGLEEYREPHYHTIVTRDVSSNNGDCKAEEEQLDNAIKASKVVDNIVQQLGIKKENIIEDTRKCIEETQKMKRDFNARFRRHVVHARDLVDAPKHKREEIQELKAMFDSDQKEGEKISAESELCAKIEMQVTILETAEYYALSTAKEKLASCRTKVPGQSVNLVPGGGVSYAEMKAGQGSPVPSIMSAAPQAAFSQPQQPPMFATITLQPPQPAARLPSIASFIQPPQVLQQQPSAFGSTHEIGMQRHFDSAPNPERPAPSILYQPHLQSHLQAPAQASQNYQAQKTNYGQPLAYNRLANYGEMVRQNYQMFKAPSLPPQQNMFEQIHGVREQPHYQPAINSAILGFMQQKQTPVIQPPPVMSAFRPQQPYISPSYPIINSFANNNNNNNKNHNNKLSPSDHHHSSTESHDDQEDWQSRLWFPGTTYSPPPSWLKSPSVDEGLSSKMSTAPFQQQQGNTPHTHSSPVVPILPFTPKPQDVHPDITEIAGQKHKEGEPGMVAPFSSLKPYVPSRQLQQAKQDISPYSSLKAFSPYKQQQPQVMTQGFFNPQPAPALVVNTPVVQPFIAPPTPMFNAPVVNSYASPQGGHEVINAGPPTEVVTINKKKPNVAQNKQAAGNLPEWLISVDAAKYPADVSDRMRGDKNDTNDSKENDSEQGPKRQFTTQPEERANVEKAVQSVNYVKKNIGTSPEGVALLIGSVKENVKSEITTTEQLLKDDTTMVSEFCGAQSAAATSSTESGGAAQKSELDKRSEIRNLACENVKKKHDLDKASHEEATKRLDMIKEIEMKETEMEVAQYFAQISKEGNEKNINLAELIRASRSPSSNPN